jgi:putative ABC transport system permease protein
MYIIKNAFRSISRSKARNILIGIIALVISVSACIALSIRESAIKAKEDTLGSMEVTAQISVDRAAMMQNAMGSGSTDKSTISSMLQGNSSLSLEELEGYAKSSYVSDFYYNLTASLNAGEDIDPIDTAGTFSRDGSSSSSSGNSSGKPSMPSGSDSGHMNKGMAFMGSQGDFTVIGYSSDDAMTSFVDGTSSIKDGSMFEEGTTDNTCIISDELATLNSLSVGDTFTLTNPNNEDETVTLTIAGIYTNTASTDSTASGMGFSTSTDSGNRIYMSYTALKQIADTSEANATTTTDATTGISSTNAIRSQVKGTYVFDSIDSYKAFQEDVRTMGLSDTYTVSSSDVTEYENSLVPLENLSQTATYFLIVVFAIGAIILVVLNIFNIRERKYEIGVLNAIGMKKKKVATQFVCEIFAVTLTAIILGAGIGAATSVPVTNKLLASQIESNKSQAESVQQSFGRGTSASSGSSGLQSLPGGSGTNSGSTSTGGKGGAFMSQMMGTTTNYLSEVSYSTDLTVILQLIGIGMALTLVASMSSVLFIMRYEPLKILANRD